MLLPEVNKSQKLAAAVLAPLNNVVGRVQLVNIYSKFFTVRYTKIYIHVVEKQLLHATYLT